MHQQSTKRLMFPILLAGAIAAALGQSAAPPSAPAPRNAHEMLNAVLWIQTSAEYRFLCEQVYQTARDGLDKALADTNWTAVLEQTGPVAQLPPAVIMDIDETVIEHSAYQGEVVRRGIAPNSDMWHASTGNYCYPAV